MFFSKPGEYEPAGLYSIGHIILLILTIIGIIIALKFTKNKRGEEVRKIIRRVTIFIWILEIIKIVFNLAIGNKNPNNFVPLYFCSIILYAGILSGFCKGTLKRVGDVFVATGAIVAGISFILCPSTSITMYPVFHYISIQSFILHGSMIYLGILVNITHYVDIKLKDIWYYAGLVLLISIIAYMFNIFFDSNLMFISKDFPGTPIHILYKYTEGFLFTFIMVVGQATVPFYVMYFLIYLYKKVYPLC